MADKKAEEPKTEEFVPDFEKANKLYKVFHTEKLGPFQGAPLFENLPIEERLAWAKVAAAK